MSSVPIKVIVKTNREDNLQNVIKKIEEIKTNLNVVIEPTIEIDLRDDLQRFANNPTYATRNIEEFSEDVKEFNEGRITLNELRERAGLQKVDDPIYDMRFVSKEFCKEQGVGGQT